MKQKSVQVKVPIFIAIIAVALLTLASVGVVQYLSDVHLKEKQVVEKSMISLQPLLTLAERNINGGNLMNLKNTNAQDLYRTNNDLLYLKMSGTSEGSPKTEIFEAIPPAAVEYIYIKEGMKEEDIKNKVSDASRIGEEGFSVDRKNLALFVRKKLNIKNGGSVEAVFSANGLAGIGMAVFKKVSVVSLGVLLGAVIVALFLGTRIAKPIHDHIATLQQILSNISEVSKGIDKSVAETSAALNEQASVASQQSTSISQITSTMEELSATSTQIADNSNSVVKIATQSLEGMEEGAETVTQVMEKMEEINKDNQNSIQVIVDLGKKSKEITKVMEIINNIADQTKLIAFNAAIEAASAGETGRRFGVVAVEIRRLADSVMESTGEIERKINEIQEAVNRLVLASEKGSKGIREGLKSTGQTVEIFKEALAGAQSTTNAAQQISLSSQQQKTANSQVVLALKEIEEGTSQTTASLGQISSIGKKLEELSANLKGLVEKFRFNEAA